MNQSKPVIPPLRLLPHVPPASRSLIPPCSPFFHLICSLLSFPQPLRSDLSSLRRTHFRHCSTVRGLRHLLLKHSAVSVRYRWRRNRTDCKPGQKMKIQADRENARQPTGTALQSGPILCILWGPVNCSVAMRFLVFFSTGGRMSIHPPCRFTLCFIFSFSSFLFPSSCSSRARCSSTRRFASSSWHLASSARRCLSAALAAFCLVVLSVFLHEIFVFFLPHFSYFIFQTKKCLALGIHWSNNDRHGGWVFWMIDITWLMPQYP